MKILSCLALVLLLSPALPALGAEPDRPPGNPHGGYRADCALCHGDTGWAPAIVSPKFKHAPGRFPLEGSHAQSSCRACHASLDFTNAAPPRECVSCHQDVHQGELGQDCSRCHTARSFIDRSRMTRAHLTTRFPLVGAHIAADCEGCHKPTAQGGRSFVNTRTECEACHMAEYAATTNPPHGAAGLPPVCGQCHTPIAWPATSSFGFDHARTGFPLTGAHRSVLCLSCHQGGVFTGLSTACVSCHQADYDRTTDPVHTAAGFPTDCAQCHSTTSWTSTSWNHDSLYFPIYSGAHRGRWQSCSTCHINTSNYSQFACWGACHEHEDPVVMASKHSGVPGYVHDSQACYSCHPRGTH